jgi:hypothetical protein
MPCLRKKSRYVLLETPRAMVLLLRLDVLQHGVALTRADRKRAISPLSEKAVISSIKRFDPFRRCFLDLLDQLMVAR